MRIVQKKAGGVGRSQPERTSYVMLKKLRFYFMGNYKFKEPKGYEDFKEKAN